MSQGGDEERGQDSNLGRGLDSEPSLPTSFSFSFPRRIGAWSAGGMGVDDRGP